eukprot:scaffold27.g5991.t1
MYHYGSILADWYNVSSMQQEDDVSITWRHMTYFLKWAKFFAGSDFCPGFMYYELAQTYSVDTNETDPSSLPMLSTSHVHLDFRIEQTTLFRFRDEEFVSFAGNPTCCMYMLDRNMLVQETARQEWLSGPQNYHGEFNP